jgi:uncharacterized glyoxalase superfamily protein PhnB
MRSNRSAPISTVIPVLSYPDVRAAVAWLTAVFGFEERVRVGENHRSQMRFGDGDLIVADTGSHREPPVPGHVVASVMVRVEDARAHCAHARAGGAQIVMEPTDFEYGERQYEALDLAGHLWTFTETLADVDPARFRTDRP